MFSKMVSLKAFFGINRKKTVAFKVHDDLVKRHASLGAASSRYKAQSIQAEKARYFIDEVREVLRSEQRYDLADLLCSALTNLPEPKAPPTNNARNARYE